MNKKIGLTIALLAFFSIMLLGCQNKTFSLDDGRYILDQYESEVTVPYILINEDRFTVVMNIAVSYQPSGKIVINDNEVIMESKFADETYTWVFTLTDNNQMTFLLNRSNVPDGSTEWNDGMVFYPINSTP